MKLSLSFKDWLYFFYYTAIVEFALSINNIEKMVEYLKNKSGSHYFDENKLLDIMRVSSYFSRKILKKPPCLRASLLLYVSVRAPLMLHIAIDKEGEKLLSHAWIEKDNQTFSTLESISNYKSIYSHAKF